MADIEPEESRNEILKIQGVELKFGDGEKNVVVENEGRKYYRSEVYVSVDTNAPSEIKERASEILKKFEGYRFTLWSQEEVKNIGEVIDKLKNEGGFFAECGLASNPDQFDNKDCSTIVSLTEEAKTKEQKMKLFLGFSCPGFGGSSLKSDEVNVDNVSAESYLKTNNFMLDVLGANLQKSIMIGHSAGGEKALGMSGRLRCVALNPAVHLVEDKVFGGFELPNAVAKFFRKGMTGKVVDFAIDSVVKWEVGARGTILGKSENKAMNSQSDVHGNEIRKNFASYIAKSKELIRLDRVFEFIGNPLLVIGGKADLLTPWDKAREYLDKMISGRSQVKILTEDDLGIKEIHHDSFFMNKELNRKVAEYIWELFNQPMIRVEIAPAIQAIVEPAPEPIPPTPMPVSEPEPVLPASSPVPETEQEKIEPKLNIYQERLDVLFRWEQFALQVKGWVNNPDDPPTVKEFTDSYKKWILDYGPIAEAIKNEHLSGPQLNEFAEQVFYDKKYKDRAFPMLSFDFSGTDDYDKIARMMDYRFGLIYICTIYTRLQTQIEKTMITENDLVNIADLSVVGSRTLPFVESQVEDGVVRPSIIEEVVEILESYRSI